MVIAIVGLAVMVIILAMVVAIQQQEYQKQETKIINLALKVSELSDMITRVDESTGASLHEMRMEYENFKTMYGEAAAEEMREAAKAEKAWADGVNSIMSYGARYQGRGDDK